MDKGFDIRSYLVSVFVGKDGTILKIQKDVGFSSKEDLLKTVAQLIPIS